ncbi:DUF294 nucleotidyltransferase-like domain-containing protein [Paenibacillus sp. JX-17]|uniref:DUF294 nucleotidyltransferase-like domain-containing protein n=1 Tax=Paenibacillus lacisoli TaxID=3064525 RepID=A0ABT9C9R8_9BACL|nr:DUF294 nucleotidyltransferase-like domain-containing protein [Paenibacillus sp. JX-17]MDO7906004.1 DUF294 nucleotidyltransferase-like domain-containing protein [Paenibacillus sp. JX-17]
MEPLRTDRIEMNYDDIRLADTPENLRQERIQLQNRLIQSMGTVPIQQWISKMNEVHDHIASRAVVLCEIGMEEEGFGPPPVPYAFIVFGSAGRKESTLWSDQDNGLIISDEEAEGKEGYFNEFGTRLSTMLHSLGYPYCEGKVMCSEPLWRQTISSWKRQIEEWCSDDAWEPIRYLIIASDMRHIAGDTQLSTSWKQTFHYCFELRSDLAYAVLRNTVRHKATLNILGRVVTERFGEHAGAFDVKYGAYIPLVNAVRYLALQHGITESSTLKRLEKLSMLEAAPLPFLEACTRAFLTSLKLRNSTPTERQQDGLLVSSGYMPMNMLKSREQGYELRESLGIVRRIHRVLQRQLRFAERRRT